MRAIDLFCGVGGASIGMARAGIRVMRAIDHDAKTVDVHRKLKETTVARIADLALVEPYVLPRVDMWWASPPCQPFSSAGARKGSADARNGYPHLLRLLRASRPEERPRWLVVENVPGLIQHRRSSHVPEGCPACYFDEVHLELSRLMGAGLMMCLDAAWYGVPQKRKRVICIYGPEALRVRIPATHGPGREHPYVSAGEALGLTTSEELYALSVGGPNARDGKGPSRTSIEEPSPTVRTHADIYLVAAGLRPDGSPCADVAPRSLSEPSPAVTGKATMQYVTPSGIYKDGSVWRRLRTLNVEERAKLQCLPFVEGMTGKMVGNAVPPPMAEAICRAILKVEEG